MSNQNKKLNGFTTEPIVRMFNNDIGVVRSGWHHYLINTERFIIAGPFRSIGELKEGKAVITEPRESYYIDQYGVKISDSYNSAKDFSNGIAVVGVLKKNHSETGYFHIDENFNPLYEKRFDFVDVFYKNTIARIREKSNRIYKINVNKGIGEAYYILTNGERAIPIDTVKSIGSRHTPLDIYDVEGKIIFTTGCFIGDVHDLKAAVELKHGMLGEESKYSKHYHDYMAVLREYGGGL